MYPKKKPPCEGGSKSNIHLNTALYSTSHYSDIEGFKVFASGYGLPLPTINADGQIHRFHVEGDKRGTRNGWYVFFSYPIAAGAVGSWKTGESFSWCSKSKQQLSKVEREALRKQYRQARQLRIQQQAQGQQQAAKRAQAIFDKAIPANPNHAYLLHKQVSVEGLLQYRDALLIPLRDIEGRLWSLQFIKPDGSKMFLSGGRTKGVFFALGAMQADGVIYIAEGFSTAATVHQWKQATTLAAMNAGNLLPVGLAVRQEYPKAKIVFAADNDRFRLGGNIGKDKAEEAARIVGGSVLLPEFPQHTKGTDWNDWYVLNKGGAHES